MKKLILNAVFAIVVVQVSSQDVYLNTFTANHDMFYARDVSGKWGYVDFYDNVKIPFKYDYVTMFSKPGLAGVALNGKFGAIDVTGKQIIPFIYDYVYPTLDLPYMIVQKDGLFGVTDRIGNIIIPITATYISPLVCNNNTFVVAKQGSWGMVNNKNETTIPFKYGYIRVDDIEGMVTAYVADKTYVIDNYGKVLDMPEYKRYYQQKGGYKTVTDQSKKTGVLNKDNQLVIPCEYTTIYQADNNPDYFIVTKSKKTGVINAKTNKLIIPINYSEITGTYFDKFFVYLQQPEDEDDEEGVWESAIFDLNGNRLFNETFTTLSTDQLNKEKIKEYNILAIAGKKSAWGIIDKNGKTILPYEFTHNLLNIGNMLIAKKSTGWGAADFKGNTVIPFLYSNPDGDSDKNPFDEWVRQDYFAVKTRSESGVIDKQGNWIVKYSDGTKVEKLSYDNYRRDYFLKATSPNGIIKVVDVKSRTEYIIPGSSNKMSAMIKTSWKQQPTYVEVSQDGNPGIFLLKEGKVYITGDFMIDDYNKDEDVFIGSKMKQPVIGLPEYIYGLVDKNKKLITPIEYDDLDYEPGLKLFYARKNDKVSIIDRNGKSVFPTTYDTVRLLLTGNDDYVRSLGFRNGYISLRKGNKQLLLSSKGEQLIDNTAYGDPFRTNIYYEAIGNFFAPVSQFYVDKVKDPLEGKYKKKLYINNKVYDAPGGSLNMMGGKIVMSEHTNMETNKLGTGINLVDGLLCLRRDGKFGYIDYTGKEVIPFEFEEAGNFEFGIAFVKKNGTYYAINRRGEIMNLNHLVTAYYNSKK